MSDAPAGVLLGVDFGKVRIGVAVSDAEQRLAFPGETVAAGESALERLRALADDHGAVGIVVGYPLALDGTPGPAARDVHAQAVELAVLVHQPVWLVDERLTTAEAAKRLRAAGWNTRQARRVIDGGAAVGILESAMAAVRAGRPPGISVG